MKTKLYYLQIAEKSFPGLKQKRFFTTIGDTEHYYSGLRMTEVQHVYRSYYDEFDFAFCIRCTFSICDKQEGSRWVRLPGDEHLYSTPPFVVVQRNTVDCAPARIVQKMRNLYQANVLLVNSYIHPNFSEQALREYLESQGIHIIFKSELPQDRMMRSTEVSLQADNRLMFAY